MTDDVCDRFIHIKKGLFQMLRKQVLFAWTFQLPAFEGDFGGLGDAENAHSYPEKPRDEYLPLRRFREAREKYV